MIGPHNGYHRYHGAVYSDQSPIAYSKPHDYICCWAKRRIASLSKIASDRLYGENSNGGLDSEGGPLSVGG